MKHRHGRRRELEKFDEYDVNPFSSRKNRRGFRKIGMIDPVYDAYMEGQVLSHYGPRELPPRLHKNPYPPGRRHDSWNHGFATERDVMGEHNGRNT